MNTKSQDQAKKPIKSIQQMYEKSCKIKEIKLQMGEMDGTSDGRQDFGGLGDFEV